MLYEDVGQRCSVVSFHTLWSCRRFCWYLKSQINISPSNMFLNSSTVSQLTLIIFATVVAPFYFVLFTKYCVLFLSWWSWKPGRHRVVSSVEMVWSWQLIVILIILIFSCTFIKLKWQNELKSEFRMFFKFSNGAFSCWAEMGCKAAVQALQYEIFLILICFL